MKLSFFNYYDVEQKEEMCKISGYYFPSFETESIINAIETLPKYDSHIVSIETDASNSYLMEEKEQK